MLPSGDQEPGNSGRGCVIADSDRGAAGGRGHPQLDIPLEFDPGVGDAGAVGRERRAHEPLRRACREITIGHDRALARVVAEPDLVGASAIGDIHKSVLVRCPSRHAFVTFRGHQALGRGVFHIDGDEIEAASDFREDEIGAVR